MCYYEHLCECKNEHSCMCNCEHSPRCSIMHMLVMPSGRVYECFILHIHEYRIVHMLVITVNRVVYVQNVAKNYTSLLSLQRNSFWYIYACFFYCERTFLDLLLDNNFLSGNGGIFLCVLRYERQSGGIMGKWRGRTGGRCINHGGTRWPL